VFKELLETKNILLSPHIAGWTTESYYKLSKVLAEKILGY
jgi:D-3-phosphoglycerate dehydrogenase